MYEPFLEAQRRAKRICFTYTGILIVYTAILIMFIISAVISSRMPDGECPNKLAMIKSVSIYTLFEDQKPTNTTFADIVYIVLDRNIEIPYKNSTTAEIVQDFNLKNIANSNGMIRVFISCDVSDKKYYLEPIKKFINSWYLSTIILGYALFFSTLFVIVTFGTIIVDKAGCLT